MQENTLPFLPHVGSFLGQLGTDSGYPLGIRGRGKLASQEYQFIVVVVYACCPPTSEVEQNSDECWWRKAYPFPALLCDCSFLHSCPCKSEFLMAFLPLCIPCHLLQT